MRLLVCGGRDYFDRGAVFAALDRVHAKRDVKFVIQGAASGADNLAVQWACEREVKVKSFRANWRVHGKRAGPVRNQQMLDEGKPDGVVAFPGGRGTANMVALARQAGVKVWEPVKSG